MMEEKGKAIVAGLIAMFEKWKEEKKVKSFPALRIEYLYNGNVSETLDFLKKYKLNGK